MNNKTALSGVQMKWLTVLAGLLCVAMATGVSAKTEDRPCKADAEKLCKGMEPGGGKIAACLKEHSSELSPACKDNIAKAKEKVKELKEACEGDAKKLCKDVKQGGGRIMQCLKQHEAELTPACKASMEKPKGKK